MMGHTHMVIGAAAGLALAQASGAPPLPAAALGAIAALIPDVDHPQAPIRERLGCVGTLLFGWLPHRGLTHTVFALGVVYLVSFLPALFGVIPPWVGVVIMAGYTSHLMADMMTVSGLAVLAPASPHVFHLPPQIRTGSAGEAAVLALVLAGVGYLYRDVIPLQQIESVLAQIMRQLG